MIPNEIKCAKCKSELQKTPIRGGVYLRCLTCGSFQIAIGILNKLENKKYVTSQILRAKALQVKSKKCPQCSNLMRTIMVNLEQSQTTLEVCQPCYSIWFEGEEYFQLYGSNIQSYHLPFDSRSVEDKKLVGKILGETLKQQNDSNFSHLNYIKPNKYFKTINTFPFPAIFTDPASLISNTNKLIACLLILTFALNHFLRIPLAEYLVFIPQTASRQFGITFVTSFFYLNNIWFLLFNLYFLLSYGSDVDYFLNPVRYFLLILTSALIGNLVIYFFTKEPTNLYFGPSGGVSGVVTFYLLKFPAKKIKISDLNGRMYSTSPFIFLLLALFQLAILLLLAGTTSNLSIFEITTGACVGSIWALFTPKAYVKNHDFTA